MRATALVYILLVTLLAICSAGSSGSSYQGGRNKPRSIRGFKNQALSTARGFGKRDGHLEYLSGASSNDQGIEKMGESMPVEWFLEELRTNPELARIIIHKFVDADQDGELTAEELLRPIY